MIFFAQIDQEAQVLKQGLGFSTAEFAQSHMAAHPEYMYVSTAGFVSPATHQYLNGQVVPIQQEQ